MQKISYIILLLLFLSCTQEKSGLSINTSHLDYLYEEITVKGIDMAIIHIYSNYPDYKYLDDDDEGAACVDDAARAAIFYFNHYNFTGNEQSIKKCKKLLKFILYLQSENGYFYNFMWGDHSINKTFKTSVAEVNWWSWRALWILTEVHPYYEKADEEFAQQIMDSINKLLSSVKSQIPKETNTELFQNRVIPTWLPKKYAADQASVILLCLTNYLNKFDDPELLEYVEKLQDGIILMQIKDNSNPYYGAFMSWQNIWHAWGNVQSYALLKSYSLNKNEEVLSAALLELDNFYRYLNEKGMISSFTLKSDGSIDEQTFSQIAYGIRPIVWALLEANKITNDKKYSVLAGQIGQWLIGKNIASTIMYNAEDGKVFDGIESADKINMNSGAESTIEALLTLLEISKNKIALQTLIKNETDLR